MGFQGLKAGIAQGNTGRLNTSVSETDPLDSLTKDLKQISLPKPEITLVAQRTNQPQGAPAAVPLPQDNGPNADEFNDQFDKLKQGATDYFEKYQRQGQGIAIPFKKGEVVQGKFEICPIYDDNHQVDKSRLGLRVFGEDGRLADQFIIKVSDQEYIDFMSNPGHVYEGILKISGEGRNFISNVFHYPAETLALRSTMTINPDRKAVETMELGATALLQGKIESIVPIDNYSSLFTLTTADGEQVQAEVASRVKFMESPGLENAANKAPEIGDIVQIRGNVSHTSSSYPATLEFPAPKQILTAPWTGSTYLINPSEARQLRFDELRADVKKNIEQLSSALENGHYDRARDLHGELCRQELTRGEHNALTMYREQFPEGQRPIAISHTYLSEPLRTRFGVDLNSLTKEEFKEFALASVSEVFGPDSEGQEHIDESYLYRAFDDAGLSIADREQILTTAINVRMEHFSQLDRNNIAYDHTRDWNDRYFLEQSLGYLTDATTDSAVDTLFGVLQTTIDNPLAGIAGDLQYKAANSFFRLAYDANSSSNSELLAHIEEKLPELKQMRQSIIDANPDRSSIAVEYLDRTIDLFKPRFDDLRRGDFQNAMQTRITELAKGNPVIEKFAEKISAENYKLRILDPSDQSIPLDIREYANNSVGAITVNSRKEVYFALDALESLAQSTDKTLEQVLAATLGNEATHVLSGATFTPMNEEERASALAEIAVAGQKHTASEESLHRIIEEEIVSEYVGRAVEARLSDKEFAIGPKYLKSPEADFTLMRKEFTRLAFERYFNMPLSKLNPNDQQVVLKRVVDFLNSSELQENIASRLKEHELFNPNK